jgi:hypothetical protein
MPTELKWRRVGAGSGPANVLNGRYRVERVSASVLWHVVDLTTGSAVGCAVRGMKAAKAVAEAQARFQPMQR